MRKLVSLLCMACLPLMLPACASVGRITTLNTHGMVLDEKVLHEAETAYNIPAAAYQSANTRGLITPSIKAVVKPKLQFMAKSLLLVRQAYKVGDGATFLDRVGALKTLSSEVSALIPH
jgi:hypothetical protein